MDKVETVRVGILGGEPLTSKNALLSARHKFIEQFQKEPTQLRVSPKSFNDLRAFAERYEYPFGFDVKVDPDMEDDEWLVCNEQTKHYAL